MTTYPAYAAPKTNGLAIAAFVLSLLGFALLPVIFGHIALGQIKRNGDTGTGFAIAGLVIGYLTAALYVILALVVIIPLIAVAASGGFA